MVAGRLLSTAIAFLTVPVYMDWVGGKDVYGVYLFTFTIAQYVALLDFVYSFGAQKILVEATADADWERARAIQRSQLALCLLTALGVFLILCLFGALGAFPAVSRKTAFVVFALSGVQAAVSIVVQTFVIYFLAYQKTLVGVVASVVRDTLAAVTTLAFGYMTHTIEGLALGAAVGGTVGFAGFLFAVRRTLPRVSFRPLLDRGVVRELSAIGVRSIPNSVIGILSNRGDRLLLGLGAATLAVFTDYANASKPADLAFALLLPINALLTPDVVRHLRDGLEAGARAAAKNGLILWTIGCCAVVVPTAGGDAFLRLWLHDKTVAQGGTIMALMAFYFVSELHFNALGSIFLARGVPHRLVGFPIFNLVATFALTLPLYHRFGLVGVAAMNACIQAAQFVPRLWICDRELEGAFRWRGYLARCAGVLGVALAFWLAVHAVPAPSGRAAGFAYLLFCLLMGSLAMVVVFATRIAPAPEALLGRLRRRAAPQT